jgi:hypothetical protein
MYYLRFKEDKHGRRWKVREAVSLKAAINCIIMACATGSVGGKDTIAEAATRSDPPTPRVLADVVRVHPDNTEVSPS